MGLDNFQRQIQEIVTRPNESSDGSNEDELRDQASPDSIRDAINSFLEQLRALGVDSEMLNSTNIDEVFLEELGNVNREQAAYESEVLTIIEDALSDFIYQSVDRVFNGSNNNGFDAGLYRQLNSLFVGRGILGERRMEFVAGVEEGIENNLRSTFNSGNFEPFFNRLDFFKRQLGSVNVLGSVLSDSNFSLEIKTFLDRLVLIEMGPNHLDAVLESPFLPTWQTKTAKYREFVTRLVNLNINSPVITQFRDEHNSFYEAWVRQIEQLTEEQTTETQEFFGSVEFRLNEIMSRINEFHNMSSDEVTPIVRSRLY